MATTPVVKTTTVAAKGMSGLFAIISPSPAVAAIIFGWANLGLIASLVVGVISTALIVWMGNIKEGDLKARVADAVSDAASANAGLAAAQVEIETQKRLTAEAQLETQRLKDKFSPRELSDLQVSQMAEALRPFSGQKFGLVAYQDSKESSGFGARMHTVLDQAGWKFDEASSQGWLLGGTEGVIVRVDPRSALKVRKAAAALIKALHDQGLEAKSVAIDDQNNPPTETVNMSIGSKN